MKKTKIMIIAAACIGLLLIAAVAILLLKPWQKEVAEPEAKTQKVGICVPEGSSVDTAILQQQLTEKGYEVSVYVQKVDQAQQITQIKTLVQEEISLVIVDPIIESAIEEILRAPQEAGIPVMIADYRGEIPEVDGGVSFISQDPTAPGLLQGEFVKKLPSGGDLNGDGTISYAVITGPADVSDVQMQLSGVRQTLDGNTQLCVRNCEDTQQNGYDLCSGILATYGRDLEVIICGTENLSIGAVTAVYDNGRTPGQDVYVVAAGNGEALKNHISAGEVFASVAQDHTQYNTRIAEIASNILAGNPYNLQYYANYYALTTETSN